jgi:glycosidase
VYDGAQVILGRYTYRQQWPERKDPSLDSVMNFPLSGGVRSFLRHSLGRWGPVRELEDAVKIAAGTSFNPTPGADGLNARQKMVNFIETHEGPGRFRVPGISARSNLLANAMILTMEGIPCLYYGTEAALEDPRGRLIGDSETGRMTFIPREKPARLAEVRGSLDFQELAAVIRLRRELPALTAGLEQTLWADSGETRKDDGIFAFARYAERDGKVDTARTVVVVFNAGTAKATTGAPGNPMRLLAKNGQPLLPKLCGMALSPAHP